MLTIGATGHFESITAILRILIDSTYVCAPILADILTARIKHNSEPDDEKMFKRNTET